MCGNRVNDHDEKDSLTGACIRRQSWCRLSSATHSRASGDGRCTEPPSISSHLRPLIIIVVCGQAFVLKRLNIWMKTQIVYSLV